MRDTKKPKKKEFYVCDRCDQAILSSTEDDWYKGYIVHGNIYVADDSRGGLIGNNFPDCTDSFGNIPPFGADEIGQTCLCHGCLAKALKMGDYGVEEKEEPF